jgi:hypothetical protein
MNQKEWTIMIYMAGDNNLAVDMAYAMEQIKGVAAEGADSPNLFVYYDGNSPSIPTLYCDFSEPRRPRYVRSYKVPDKLYPVPARQNENAADKKSIVNFVDWCVNKVEVVSESGEITNGRRAQKYAMIFSGHSLGFQDIGLFKDETSGKSMKMSDLYIVLERLVCTQEELDRDARKAGLKGDLLRQDTKLLLGQKLDLLGFDSCVMGMLEVGYQFERAAKTMIASEGSVPNAGWTYAKILGCLTRRDGNTDCWHVAADFVRNFIKTQDSYTVGGVSVDMAAWDLSRMPDVTRAFDALAEVLIACFENPDTRVYRQMERIILQAHWKSQTYMYDQNVDIGDFCELLARECSLVIDELGGGEDLEILHEVQDKCRGVLDELKKAVILSGFSGGAYQYSNGMSAFFPWSREGYEVSRKNYESLWFARDAGRNKRFTWTGFLKKYLNEVALRRFEPETPEAAPGEKYRYFSGIMFQEMADAAVAGNGDMTKLPGQEGSKLPGQEGSKLPGQEGSKLPGQEGSKLPGQEGSKLPGQEGSKLAGQEGSKLPGQEGSKLPGQEGSKLAGQEGSKLAGQEGSKLAGQEGSKLAGQEGSKLAGQEGSKLAGQEGSKLAGQEGSKLAGQEGSKLGGPGSTAFFDSLRLFKNIETRWNISGFTKRPKEAAQEKKNAAG